MAQPTEVSARAWAVTEFEAFDTVNRIILPEENRELLPQCLALCRHFHRLFAPYEPGSDVFRMRQNSGQISVHPDTSRIMKLALEIGRRTDGAFDITIGSAVSLWDFKHRTNAPPSSDELAQAAACCCLDRISVNDNTVTMPLDAKPDLGGIAKGFIADQLTDFLTSLGVKRAMLDLGGNIALLGEKSPGHLWRVGLQRPSCSRNNIFGVFCGTNCSVVTSSAGERNLTLDGKRYHHLLNPKTGWPAEESLHSVTIIAQNSATADALSTACFVAGAEKASELLSRFSADSVDAILLRADGSVILTPGLHHSKQFTPCGAIPVQILS